MIDMTREEALKIVRENYPHFGTTEPWLDLEKALATLVPELRESEDERIRKEIIKFIQDFCNPCDPDCDKWIAYLERQKEQKPEHFELKAGKWYICHRAFCCRADHLTVKEGERFQCEKDGIVKGFVIKEPEKYFKECSAPAPMEDEQKEQNPSINIDQLKSMMLQYLQEAANEKDDSDIEADTDKWARKILGYDFEQKSEEYIKRNSKEWYALLSEQYNKGYWNGKASQKPEERFEEAREKYQVEWSEEDESKMGVIIRLVEQNSGWPYRAIKEYVNWLKSLRPVKQELSEDVKKTLDEVSHILVGLNYKQIAKDYKQAVEKLLYSRLSWKPSEEQMEALEEEILNQWEDYPHDKWPKCPYHDFTNIARHFYELGQSQMPMPEDTVLFNKGVAEGRRLEREDMLKDAVEGYVNYYEDSGGILMAEAQVGCPYHNGDKVRIVVIKEEEE